MDYKALEAMKNPPQAFDPLDGPFWADPYIGRLSLAGHLDETSDDASRPGDKIRHETKWFQSLFPQGFTGRFLDLGCGPGLYALPMAKSGWSVTGLDLNGHSITHAQNRFKELNLPGTFKKGDFLTGSWPGSQDLIACVYGTIGTISPVQEELFWKKAWDALIPGGLLVFDVFTKSYVEGEKNRTFAQNWGAFPRGGFWSPQPHLSLVSVFDYPDLNTFLRCYTVVQDHRVKHYPFWYRWHDQSDYCAKGSWEIGLYQGLGPQAYDGTGDWIGVVAKKLLGKG